MDSVTKPLKMLSLKNKTKRNNPKSNNKKPYTQVLRYFNPKKLLTDLFSAQQRADNIFLLDMVTWVYF